MGFVLIILRRRCLVGECFLCHEKIEKDEAQMETLLYGRVHWDCYHDE